MTEMNPAFVLQSVQNFSFENRKVPELRDEYDVRVHVEKTGICGSDIHWWQHGHIGNTVVTNPLVLGHESSGRVVEVGKEVKNVKVGDLVAIEYGEQCRRCEHCRAGEYNLCYETLTAESPVWDGTLQKYYIIASDFCYPLPSHMNAEDGALVEPLAVAVEICKVADLKAGQTVLVFGCGPIGALSQAVAKAHGAKKVIGVDISESRAAFAKSFAADDVYVPDRPSAPAINSMNASQELAQKISNKFFLGDGADVVLECSGAESCIQAGVLATRKGGTYVQAGLGRENVVFPITATCVRGLKIKGAIRYTAGCYPAAIDLIASGRVKARSLVTHRFAFEQALEAFEIVKKGEPNTMKVIIQGVQ
ncbi:GroES-like protein [Annulohypoxylon moriforme]|nr:GroES-like protein [Annulohypoxylon moriforme]